MNIRLCSRASSLADNLSPQFPLEFVIDTQRAGGALNPDFLQRVAELENRLHSNTGSSPHYIVTTITHAGEQNPHSELRRLPLQSADGGPNICCCWNWQDTREYERLVNFDYSTVRVAPNIEDAGSYRINQIRDEIEPWLRENFPG